MDDEQKTTSNPLMRRDFNVIRSKGHMRLIVRPMINEKHVSIKNA